MWDNKKITPSQERRTNMIMALLAFIVMIAFFILMNAIWIQKSWLSVLFAATGLMIFSGLLAAIFFFRR